LRRDEVPDLAAKRPGIRKVKRRLPPVDNDAVELGCVRVQLHAVPATDVGYLAEHGAVGPPCPLEDEEDREHDRDHDPREHTEHDHAGAGDE
jgi:hypothetical protein